MRLSAVEISFLLVGNAFLGYSQPQVSITPRPRAVTPVLPGSDFRLDVKMVEIPVTVTDILEHPVLGLQKADFKLFEDGAEQQVVTFSQMDAPASVGVVFDTSGSMKGRLAASRAAVAQFLK